MNDAIVANIFAMASASVTGVLGAAAAFGDIDPVYPLLTFISWGVWASCNLLYLGIKR